jgi:hypothetical protein
VRSTFHRRLSHRNLRQARHAVSHTSCSSQSHRRHQPVLGEGYCFGKSFQRALVRKIYRLPLKQERLGIDLRPPGRRLGLREQGCDFSHCSLVNSDMSLAIFFLLVMANYTRTGQQNARQVLIQLLEAFRGLSLAS